MLGANERGGFYANDEAYKMATTDAISVACKNLGIAADVYFERDVTKYNDPKREQYQQAPQPSEADILRELHETSEAEAMAEQPRERRLSPKEQVRERMKTLDSESARELSQPITPQEIQTLIGYANEVGISIDRVVASYEKGRPENLTKAEYANAIQNLMVTKERLERKTKSRIVAKGA